MKRIRWIRCVLAAALCIVAPTLALSQQASYYVLDGFGGVHAGGDAPAIAPAPPYFGFDVAQDLAYVAVGKRVGTVDLAGDGVVVLDGFGGIHVGGALPRSMTTPTTPYFGFDMARAIVARNVPPRISGREEPKERLYSLDGNYHPVATATIRAPDDGFLLILASISLECWGHGTSEVAAVVSLGLDSITPAPNNSQATTLRFCDRRREGESFSLVKAWPVSAGPHFVHLLVNANQLGSDSYLRVYAGGRSLQLLFIDQDGMGGS